MSMDADKRRALPKTLREGEARALLSRPNLGCPTGLRNRCMMELMYRNGFRVSDVCGVHLRDVDWRAGTIRIRPEVAKGGREAVAYLHENTMGFLQQWKAIRRPYAKGAPWLFITLTGKPVWRQYVWSMVERYARKAGIEQHVHPHMLRHTFATDLLGGGFNIREVQSAMRHSNLGTTAIYLHVRDEDLAKKLRERSFS